MNSAPQQFGLTPSRNAPGLNFVPSCRISSIPNWKTSHSACTAHLRVLMWPVTVAFFLEFNFFFASREVLKEARIGDFSLVVLTIEALKRCAKEGWAVKSHSIDFLGSFEHTTNWNSDLPGRRRKSFPPYFWMSINVSCELIQFLWFCLLDGSHRHKMRHSISNKISKSVN